MIGEKMDAKIEFWLKTNAELLQYMIDEDIEKDVLIKTVLRHERTIQALKDIQFNIDDLEKELR